MITKMLDNAANSCQIPLETVNCSLERNQRVSEGLLKLADARDVDTMVCGISGYR